MRLPVLASLCLLVACGSDPDGDGLTNAEERELGTGVGIADSDGDGLEDGEEVHEHGTDPLEPDTDLDGFEDGEEVEAGTDPTDPLAFPDTRWPDGSARIPTDEARGWEDGVHAPDFRGTDQRGETLHLDALYGHVVVLQLVAGDFCGECAGQASAGQALQDERGAEGLYVMHLTVDDDSRDGEVDASFAATWADRHDLTFPVVVSPTGASSLFEAGVYDGRIPLTILLDRGHRVQGTWQGAGGLDEAEELLGTLLSQPAP